MSDQKTLNVIENLWGSDENFHNMFAKHHAVMLIVEPVSGQIVDANPSAEQFYGYPAELLRAMTISEINTLPPDEVAQERQRALQEKRNYFIFPHSLANGAVRMVEVDSSPIKLAKQPLLFSIIHDITERKQVEEALRESEDKFKYLFEHSIIGKSLTRPSGEINVNQALCDMLGYSQAEMQNKKWQEITHPDDIELTQREVDKLLSGEQDSARFIKRYLHKDGSVVWTDLSTALRRDQDKKPLYFMTALIDITERKQAEEAIKASEKKYRLLHESMMDGFVRVALDGKFLESNEVYRQMLGYSQTELERLTYVDITPEKWRAFEADIVQNQILKRGYSDVYEKEYRRKDGTLFPVEFHTVLMRDMEGNPTSMWGIVRDITLRKRSEEALRESEIKFRQTFDLSPVGIVMVGLDKRFTHCNHAFSQSLGYGQEDLIGKLIEEVTLPEDKLIGMAEMMAMMKGEIAHSHVNKRYVRKDGQVVWGEVTISLVRDSEGRAQYFLGIIQNITERKQAEEKLKESLALLRIAEQAAKLGGWSVNLETNRSTWSDEVAAIHEEPAGFSPLVEEGINFYAPEWRDKITQVFTDCAQNGIPYNEEMEIITAKGKRVWVQTMGEAVRNKEGRIYKVQGAFQDISERKQIEQKIQKITRHYQALIEKSPDGIVLLNAEGRMKFASPATKRMFGYALSDEFTGNPAELTHPDDLNLVLPELMRLLEEPSYAPTLQYRMVTKSGNWKWVESTFTNLLTDPDVEAIVINFRDVTERKQAEIEQQASERRFRTIIEISPVPMVLNDDKQNITFLNKAFIETFGYTMQDIPTLSDWWPKAYPDLEYQKWVSQEWLSRLEQAKLTGKTFLPMEVNVRCKDGTSKTVIASASSLTKAFEKEHLVLLYDITEFKRAEDVIKNYASELEERVEERTQALRDAQEKLIRSEKLSVLGQMASSVGHELRNPLNIINSAVYYLKMIQPDAPDKVKEYHAKIEQEVRNSDKIITDLLDFARVKNVDREVVSVSDLVRQTLERFPAPANVEVTLDIPAGLPPVFVDPLQMIQVLGNLTVNACQAMKDGGKLVVLSRLEETENEGQLTEDGKPSIVISVKDTGTGITPENMKKLFEPLFTTKAKGIGLGLAVSQKLTEANGGRIEVQSEPGVGSTFILYLPIHS
jgi:PAS domain S-box-containing protein